MFCRVVHRKRLSLWSASRAAVSIWSPLAEAFNTRPVPKFNLRSKDVGLFCVPELTTHDGFYALKENCIRRTDKLIAEALSSSRSRKMVQIFDEISDCLCQVADLAEFVRLSHPQGEYSHAAQVACATVSGIVEKLNTNIALYKALSVAVREGDCVKTTGIDNHVGELFLFDFEQCGIHLSDEKRNTVVALNNDILHLGKYLFYLKYLHIIQSESFLVLWHVEIKSITYYCTTEIMFMSTDITK